MPKQAWGSLLNEYMSACVRACVLSGLKIKINKIWVKWEKKNTKSSGIRGGFSNAILFSHLYDNFSTFFTAVSWTPPPRVHATIGVKMDFKSKLKFTEEKHYRYY